MWMGKIDGVKHSVVSCDALLCSMNHGVVSYDG